MHSIISLMFSAVFQSLRDGASLQLELIALRHQLLVIKRKRRTRPRLQPTTSAARIATSLLWTRSSATGLSKTRVGSEILCGREGEVREGRIMALGRCWGCTTEARFFGLVGSPPNSSGPRMTAYGCKPKFNDAGSASGAK